MLKATDEVLEKSLYGNQQPNIELMHKLQSSIKKLYKTHLGSENRAFEFKFASHQVLTKTEEDLLNKYILAFSKMEYGLTCIQVKKLAYEFAKANDIKYPANLRKPENTNAIRSFGFNKTAVNDLFQNLENIYRK
ncbi:unnamed protein product [Euphydryas editha]|uniref:Uncharacterized protein n=1 Tax=Euphydryas editha TaxID=104508 RepID=A0AAU9UH93_EUPED|nr:unnamed protein product [Euphydryas editha]